MTMTRAARAAISAGFVLFTLGALREAADPGAAWGGGLLPTAQAAKACGLPPVEALARNWKVTSTGCTTDCRQTHLQKGDKLAFEQDLSGERNFSLVIQPATAGRAASRTPGYTLAADGVGNVTGPVVFEHDALDGSPLDLHWLIIKVRQYDASGSGVCQLRARVQVCDREPAKDAGSCNALQHGGDIHIDPY